MVYDAFGKLVAEYGIAAESSGGVKYVQQDWQGSVRTVTNNNGFVVARTDHQAFGEDVGLGVGLRSIEQGYNTDKVTRQGYGLTENDKATGQQHTWFRKLETMAGRWTRPDPYKGSMSINTPQSFNRYTYVENDPLNVIDPNGLCLFRINIVVSSTNSPSTDYSNGTVRQTAQDEIARILNQAGHQVTFDSTLKVDAAYTLTIQAGTRDNSIASGYQGTGVGSLWAGQLANMATQPGGSAGSTNAGIGLAIGRVAAHEAVTHNFLNYSNSRHTSSGLTRASFGTEVFRSDNTSVNSFLIPKEQARLLDWLCKPPPVDYYDGIFIGGGGNIDSGGGYIGGGYPSWWYSMWDFVNWVNSIPVYQDVRIL